LPRSELCSTTRVYGELKIINLINNFMENFENKNTLEYWKKEVQRLEGELEIAKQKRNSFENQNNNLGGQIEKLQQVI
jgi:hypothetical protein